MKPEVTNLYAKLYDNLQDLVKGYRGLLNIVRQEREILVAAKIENLNKNNGDKEKVLLHLKKLETSRIQIVANLVQAGGMNSVNPSLQELAQFFPGEEGEKLRNLHSVLELLVRRVKELNLENEVLVQSALQKLNGAMKNLKMSLDDNKTYRNKGTMTEKTEVSSGQLVSKQA